MQGPYPYYGPTGVQDNLDHYRLDGEYALIGEDGDHFLKWKERSMTLLVRGKFNVNNHAHVIKGSKNRTAWFYYSFAHRDLTSCLTRQGAGRYKLTKAALLEIPCAIPPNLAEQEAIANALSNADTYIESLEKLIAKKRLIKKGVMQELLTGKRRLPGFAEKWKETQLGKIGNINPDSLGASTPSDYQFNYISLENVDTGLLLGSTFETFSTAPSRARRRLASGDILVANVRPNLKSHLLFNRSEPHWVCSTGFTVVRCDSAIACPEFVFFQLFAGESAKQIEVLVTGSNYPAINSSDVSELRLPAPHVDEQRAIASILSDMESEIQKLVTQAEKAKLLKQGMMQELLTGRIRLI
jgi:type I restriction enzyme S subunit